MLLVWLLAGASADLSAVGCGNVLMLLVLTPAATAPPGTACATPAPPHAGCFGGGAGTGGAGGAAARGRWSACCCVCWAAEGLPGGGQHASTVLASARGRFKRAIEQHGCWSRLQALVACMRAAALQLNMHWGCIEPGTIDRLINKHVGQDRLCQASL
jgi:hypothetical protein